MLKNMEDYVPPEGWKPQRLVKKRLGHRRHSTIIHLLHLGLPRNGAYGIPPRHMVHSKLANSTGKLMINNWIFWVLFVD